MQTIVNEKAVIKAAKQAGYRVAPTRHGYSVHRVSASKYTTYVGTATTLTDILEFIYR